MQWRLNGRAIGPLAVAIFSLVAATLAAPTGPGRTYAQPVASGAAWIGGDGAGLVQQIQTKKKRPTVKQCAERCDKTYCLGKPAACMDTCISRCRS